MSSSTSSSNRASSDRASSETAGSGAAKSEATGSRGALLRVFLVCLLGMGASLLLVRGFTAANGVSGGSILARVTEALEALPQIVNEEQDLVMVFGSSMVDAGFSPRQFDRQMGERGVDVKSFNFGFGGQNPYFQDYIARRIQEAFDAEGRRLELAVIEFNPFQNTQSRHQGALPARDSFVVMLASPAEIWEIAKKDPARGARLATIYYLRDGISAEMITHYFGNALRPDTPVSALPHDEAAMERIEEIGELMGEALETDYPDYPDSEWYYPWQGAGTIPEERTQETRDAYAEYYEILRSPKFLEDDKLNRIDCCDIENLEFEEELLGAFLRIVTTFQSFSDHVEVVLLPRNTDWIRYTPETAARLEAVLDRIRAETGVSVVNMQEVPGITPEMFSDTTHLSKYEGDVLFTRHLVDRYAELLGASPVEAHAESGSTGLGDVGSTAPTAETLAETVAESVER